MGRQGLALARSSGRSQSGRFLTAVAPAAAGSVQDTASLCLCYDRVLIWAHEPWRSHSAINLHIQVLKNKTALSTSSLSHTQRPPPTTQQRFHHWHRHRPWQAVCRRDQLERSPFDPGTRRQSVISTLNSDSKSTTGPPSPRLRFS